MVGWFSLAFCCLGFAGLALAMPRHQQAAFRRPLSWAGRWLLRLAGWTLLALSLALACGGWSNLAIALTAWLGIATVAAFLVAMGLTVRGA